MQRITIIGAGIAGLTCAVEFAERGAFVEVLERSNAIGPESCSWYAGGMLAPWCEREHSNDLVSVLGERSLHWWREKFPGTVQRGTLVVAQGRDVAELTRLSRRTDGFEWLDGNGIGAIEPSLAGRCNAALLFKNEAHLDPREALQSLAHRFTELGGKIRFGTTEVLASTDEGTIVDCTGLAAREVLTDLRGVKGEMLILRSREVTLSRPVRMLHPRTPVYVVPRSDGAFMVGATMIESDDARRITARSIMQLLGAAYALHPAFGEAEVIEMGTQVRPAFPDNLPSIRRRGGRLYINGFYRHGFLLAPALAHMAANIVLDNRDYPEVMA